MWGGAETARRVPGRPVCCIALLCGVWLTEQKAEIVTRGTSSGFSREATLVRVDWKVELPRFRGRLWAFAPSGSSPSFSAAGSGPAYGTGQPPPLPVRRPAGRCAESRTRDVDLEDLAGMSDDEIADPLRDSGPAAGDWFLACERLSDRSPFRVGEPDVRSVTPRVGDRRSSELGHSTS